MPVGNLCCKEIPYGLLPLDSCLPLLLLIFRYFLSFLTLPDIFGMLFVHLCCTYSAPSATALHIVLSTQLALSTRSAFTVGLPTRLIGEHDFFTYYYQFFVLIFSYCCCCCIFCTFYLGAARNIYSLSLYVYLQAHLHRYTHVQRWQNAMNPPASAGDPRRCRS